MESMSRSESTRMVSGPASSWDLPGKRIEGYCRVKETTFTSCPASPRARERRAM